MNVVIIGAGPAGITAAETLRQYGSDAHIVMLTDEPFPPYSPPAMVTFFETGDPVHFWKGHDFAEKLDIDYRSGLRVVWVDIAQRVVGVDNGETLSYDRLVVASGGRLYAPLEGAHKRGIYNFKSLTAAQELIRLVREGQAHTALIVGAGFIGVEIALLLADMGVQVTQLVRSRVMRSMLDPESSELVLDMIQARGVHVVRGDEANAVAFLGESKATAVGMASGSERAADLLVAATGLRPNIEFLDGAGLDTDWGILVDEHQRTSDPAVYAAGDVAETVDRLTGKRYVHAIFPNAIEQGRVVAQNLVGWETSYEGADNMNSLKHLGLPIMAVGEAQGKELAVRRNGMLRKIFFDQGRIVGFRLVGDVRAAGIYRSLMNRRLDLGQVQQQLLHPHFGMGTIEDWASPS